MLLAIVICLLFTHSLGLTTRLNQPNGVLDITSLSSNVQHLEESLSEVQSEAKIQEQKYSAVLSSVLSKLTATTDELNMVKADLTNLKTKHNSTVTELAQMKTELAAAERPQHNTNTSNVCHQEAKNVSFYATQTGNMPSDARTLQFNEVKFSTEGGYDNSTGIFTVPVARTCILWGYVVFTKSANGNHWLYVKKGEDELATGFVQVGSDDHLGVATLMTVTHLHVGDSIHFSTNSDKHVHTGNGRSNYCGALLHADVN